MSAGSLNFLCEGDFTDQLFQPNHTKTTREGCAWNTQLQQYAVEHSGNSNMCTGHWKCLEMWRNGLKKKTKNDEVSLDTYGVIFKCFENKHEPLSAQDIKHINDMTFLLSIPKAMEAL